MLAVALSLDSTSALPEPTLWALLGCGTATLLTGMALMACFMVPKYRKTFYKHLPFKRYVDEWMWEERAFGNKGEGADFSRADVLGYAVWTWPSDEKVRTWLGENWERWEREQPAFFTEQWQKRIRRAAPRGAVPDALRAKFDEMARKEKEEKKIAAQKGSTKVVPESEADSNEGGTRSAPPAESEAEGDESGQSGPRCAPASLLGEGAGEEKTVEECM